MSPSRFRRAFLLILALGCLLRVGLILARPIDSLEAMNQKPGDEKYYYAIAQSIAERGEYTEGHLKAYRPPGYPAFLALNLAIFGRDTRVVQWEQNLLYVAAAVLFALLLYSRFGGATVLASLVLLLFNPVGFQLPQQALSETVFLFLVVLGLFPFVRRRRNVRGYFFAGAILGAATLFREIGLFYGIFLALFVLGTGWKAKGRAKAGREAGAVLAGLVLVILPWTARNALVLHAFVPVTTNGAINLYIGNYPGATGSYHWAMPPEASKIWNTPLPHSEMRAYRICAREALAYMASHPGRTFWNGIGKALSFWSPTPAQSTESPADRLFRFLRFAFWVPYAGLAGYGLWRLRRERLGRIIVGLSLVGTGIHALTFTDPRFRALYDFLFAAPAAYAIVLLLTSQRRTGSPITNRIRSDRKNSEAMDRAYVS
ncbi:MAG: glycosyltransferase family 39 protein [Armatimonadetes bacterium]|nr:glycosyltransferase family 39 protein [Armatimonadota bacterium]